MVLPLSISIHLTLMIPFSCTVTVTIMMIVTSLTLRMTPLNLVTSVTLTSIFPVRTWHRVQCIE